jgi:hypothetical protein
MPRVGEKFAYEMSWQEQIGLESLVKPREEPMSDERAQPIRVGDVFTLDGRQMRVLGMSDGVTVCRDRKGRIAARNVETNRLSYVSEHRLSEDRRARVHELKCWPEYFAAIFDGSKTKTAQAREVQALITAWQDAAASDHAHAQRQAERAEQAEARVAKLEGALRQARVLLDTARLLLEPECGHQGYEARALRERLGQRLSWGQVGVPEDGALLVECYEVLGRLSAARAGHEGESRWQAVLNRRRYSC